jgi:hypothetical protein
VLVLGWVTAWEYGVVKCDLRPNEDRNFVNRAYMVVYCSSIAVPTLGLFFFDDFLFLGEGGCDSATEETEETEETNN